MRCNWRPDWTPRDRLSEGEIVRRAAQRSLRALGVATPRQIERHFIRGRYPKLATALAELETEKVIERVEIVDGGEPWKGEWFTSGPRPVRPDGFNQAGVYPVDTIWLNGVSSYDSNYEGLSAVLRMVDNTHVDGWIYTTPTP